LQHAPLPDQEIAFYVESKNRMTCPVFQGLRSLGNSHDERNLYIKDYPNAPGDLVFHNCYFISGISDILSQIKISQVNDY
jgi:hypothetical protein